MFGCRTYNHKVRQIQRTAIRSLVRFPHFSIDRFMIGGAFFFAIDSSLRMIIMRLTVLDHVFMFIHYFIDTFHFAGRSFSWFITKCFFMVAHKSHKRRRRMTRRYLWSLSLLLSLCGLITRREREKAKTNIELVSIAMLWCSLWLQSNLPRNVKVFQKITAKFPSSQREKVSIDDFVSWPWPVISRLTFINLANFSNILFKSSRCDEILLNEN